MSQQSSKPQGHEVISSHPPRPVSQASYPSNFPHDAASISPPQNMPQYIPSGYVDQNSIYTNVMYPTSIPTGNFGYDYSGTTMPYPQGYPSYAYPSAYSGGYMPMNVPSYTQQTQQTQQAPQLADTSLTGQDMGMGRTTPGSTSVSVSSHSRNASEDDIHASYGGLGGFPNPTGYVMYNATSGYPETAAGGVPAAVMAQPYPMYSSYISNPSTAGYSGDMSYNYGGYGDYIDPNIQTYQQPQQLQQQAQQHLPQQSQQQSQQLQQLQHTQYPQQQEQPQQFFPMDSSSLYPVGVHASYIPIPTYGAGYSGTPSVDSYSS